MAATEQYQMDAAAEIAMARSAAPATVSGQAEVLVMGTSSYRSAEKGTNGWVCLVERSWDNDIGNPDFWNPRVRVPICYNPAAARSVLPSYLKRTRWVLAGMTVAKMKESGSAVWATAPEVGAMIYMMSKDGYLGDDVKGPWHPHLMFLLPNTSASAWGAGLDPNSEQSPVLIRSAPGAAVTVFVVRVRHWGDGSEDATTS